MVLRSCVALSLLFSTIQPFAQPFEAAYVRSDEAYYFNKGGQFSWFHQTSDAKELGNGKYIVKNDSIHLYFSRAQRQFDIQAQSAEKNITPNATLRVNAIRATGKPFRGLKFVLLKSNVTGETDQSGTATIEIENPLPKDNIHFELDGYRTIELPIGLKGLNTFVAIVVDDVTKYRENTSAKFKISRSRRTLRLQDNKGEKMFKKTTPKKYRSQYLF